MCVDAVAADEDDWDDVVDLLADCASEMIRDNHLNEDDIWDDDEWNEDEEDNYNESMNRRILHHEKNEAFDSELQDAVEDWYWNNLTDDDFDSRNQWVRVMMALAKRKDPATVRACAEEIGYPDKWRKVSSILSKLAKEDVDEEDLDPFDESMNR